MVVTCPKTGGAAEVVALLTNGGAVGSDVSAWTVIAEGAGGACEVPSAELAAEAPVLLASGWEVASVV